MLPEAVSEVDSGGVEAAAAEGHVGIWEDRRVDVYRDHRCVRSLDGVAVDPQQGIGRSGTISSPTGPGALASL